MNTSELINKLKVYSCYLFYNKDTLDSIFQNNDISTNLPNLLCEIGEKLSSLDKENQELRSRLDLYTIQRSIDKDNDYDET